MASFPCFNPFPFLLFQLLIRNPPSTSRSLRDHHHDSKKPYQKLEHASEKSKRHKHGDQVQVPEGYMALYVGEERRRKYKVSLKCLSCQAFQEEIIKSQPDAFDAKIEGPFLLLSYSTTPLLAKTIASLERAAVSALLTILIRPEPQLLLAWLICLCGS
ncbi:unnamed protein product [Prunus armeniaca]|uniref:Uncharacterized protein n=1 Tax=Prunus armeniaca TaxID=36596 RepID=A0A6J5W4L5_PRUAR|nr:unnamed protein product [Prunus armeniaca]